jgi:hypothetical protein
MYISAALGKCDVGSDLFHSECTDFYMASALLTGGISIGGLAFSGYWINFADLRYAFVSFVWVTRFASSHTDSHRLTCPLC